MARLNEPTAPVDNFDILRRKFLRQNRDIARVNSNQSLRIRGLENECARLLSENLDLRGQVLRLEKEVENDKSQRVADHALQIKEKMEAQLVELGALLAGFGLEPPTKRHSPVAAARRRTGSDKPVRLSMSVESTPTRYSYTRPPPLSPDEAESLAIQEGRLPPIYETKTFPRRTLGQDEILALQADDSKAAGPADVVDQSPSPRMPRDVKDMKKKTAEAGIKPPVGIFDRTVPPLKAQAADVVKEPTKSSPARVNHTMEVLTHEAAPAAAAAAATAANQSPTPKKKTTTIQTAAPSPAPAVSTAPMPAVISMAPAATSSRNTGKRKFAVNDENAALRGISAGNENNKPPPAIQKDHTNSPVQTRELKNPRSIRSLVNRKETQEVPMEAKTTAPIRQPLAAKSTNKDISTPRKQAANGKDKPKDTSNSNSNNNNYTGKPTEPVGRRSRAKMTVAANIAGPSPPEVAEIHVNDDKPTEAPAPSEAHRERKQPAKHEASRSEPTVAHVEPEEAHAVCPSTPPPRPTTALPLQQRSAAVHDEGRDTPPPVDISSQGEASRPSRRSRTSVSYAEPNLRDKMRRPTKELFDAVAGEGKYVQRHSLHHQPGQESDEDGHHVEGAAAGAPQLGPENQESQAPVADHQPVAASVPQNTATGQDPYEFTVASSSSPPLEADDEAEAAVDKTKAAPSGRKASSRSKGSRRVSATTTPRDDDAAPVADRPTRPTTSRKRASMTAAKRGSLPDSDENDQADSSYEPSAAESTEAVETDGRTASARDRISRRRSMML